MDGFALAERIKEFPGLGKVSILMLTSDSQTNALARCRDVGIAAHLIKPIKQSELLDSILGLGNIAPASIQPPTIEVPAVTLIEDARALRILLAEDNIVNQILAVRLIEKRGHAVTVAKDGLEALRAHEDESFDLILMDLQMPQMGGIEATATIRAREIVSGAHIPIVAMTAHAMTGDRERCMEAGMDGYLSKPINAQLLYTTVEHLAKRASLLEDAGAILLRAEESAQHEANEQSIFEEANLERFAGDEELFIEIANLFLDTHQEMLTIIQEAIRVGDGPALQRAAHTLKGSAGNFSAPGVVERCMELQEIVSIGMLDRSNEVYVGLEREMKQLTGSLEKFVEGRVLCIA